VQPNVNPFRSLRDYEEFIYTLSVRFPLIQSSTLILYRRGANLGMVSGELFLRDGYRLVVRERFQLRNQSVIIIRYGHEVWQGQDKLYWYDSQPHPNNPELAPPHPHHQHIPPDITHNRIPAPGLSFNRPNLPLLIQEIELDYLG
jgi:hypothetical protein